MTRCSTRTRCRADDERGVVAVMFALMLTVVLAVTALVIDLGNARQLRREAQASADAAALAGGEAIESDNQVRIDGTFSWPAVVTQIKRYARANDNIETSAWVNCNDPYQLAYRPDSANNNNCISASASSFPAPSATSVGENVISLRVRLPSSTVKTFFAKALGNGDLTVGATATTKIVFTVTQVTTPAVMSGGPCALCILGSGFTLDGQNGDVAVTGGNVVVNSTYNDNSCHCAASLNSNGHVTLTTSGGTIGGPGAPGNFSGTGYSPAPTYQAAIVDPLREVPQCGDGSHWDGTANAFVTGANHCPTTAGNTANATRSNTTLTPGIYSTISGSHTLQPGIYVITGGITLNGNDLIQGDGVMLYFGCSNYPTACSSNQTGAGITATGNGAMRTTGITQAQCTADANLCPYVGMMSFADRNNAATQTWRGNGTNELGQQSGMSGTIYMANGTMDLRGNGFQLASQIVTSSFTMKGNPSTVSISYDQSKNYTETHIEGVASYTGTPDNNGLSG